jgi:putative transposase
VVESFFSSLKRELFGDVVFENRAVARQVVFEFIEVFSNRQRCQKALGDLTPLEFERQAAAASLQRRSIGATPARAHLLLGQLNGHGR